MALDPMPCRRPGIQATPIEHEGEQYFLVYDAGSLSRAKLLMPPMALFILEMLDGAHSILDIQDQFQRTFQGQGLATDEIDAILEELDQALFLEGARFEAHLERQRRDFDAEPIRAASSAGLSYNDNPAELAKELDGMIAAAPPPETRPAAPRKTDPSAPPLCPRGAIIPHIDYTRGAPGYGQAYRELSHRQPPEVAVIIGTAHHMIANRYVVAEKDFAVPGGRLACDRDFARALIEKGAPAADWREDGFVHRGEHSVELQCVWLHHIWGEAVRIVPVLAGSLQPFLEGAPTTATADEQARLFRDGVRELSQGRRVLVLASADLAHVGPHFGDEREISETFLQETETADRAYLEAVAAGDGVGGLRALAAHQDRYHVCGAACIFALNQILGDTPGRLLGYHQAATPELGQAVSFASLLFE